MQSFHLHLGGYGDNFLADCRHVPEFQSRVAEFWQLKCKSYIEIIISPASKQDIPFEYYQQIDIHQTSSRHKRQLRSCLRPGYLPGDRKDACTNRRANSDCLKCKLI